MSSTLSPLMSTATYNICRRSMFLHNLPPNMHSYYSPNHFCYQTNHQNFKIKSCIKSPFQVIHGRSDLRYLGGLANSLTKFVSILIKFIQIQLSAAKIKLKHIVKYSTWTSIAVNTLTKVIERNMQIIWIINCKLRQNNCLILSHLSYANS